VVDERLIISQKDKTDISELWSSTVVAEYLGITMNNLRQIESRKSIYWAIKKGRSVYYSPALVIEYRKKRDARK
jgi:hypothetical protein